MLIICNSLVITAIILFEKKIKAYVTVREPLQGSKFTLLNQFQSKCVKNLKFAF